MPRARSRSSKPAVSLGGVASRHHALPIALAALLAVACGSGSLPRSAGPNLLLITIDTLRADHVSAYGYARSTMPSVDRLAREGVRFETANAQRAQTWPSLTSIHTGTYPRTHGVRINGQKRGSLRPTIAEALSDAGIATAAFVTNMGTVQHRGFDHVLAWPDDEINQKLHHELDLRATRAARAWIRQHAKERFFVWLHLLGPHDPYAPPDDQPRRFATGYQGDLDGANRTLTLIKRRQRVLAQDELAHIVSLYDEDIATVDLRVAEILAELDALSLENDTLVVFTSDHGEELYDHGFYFLHSFSDYQSVLHVPLVMRLPGRLAAGSVVSALVESVDIAPTLIELMGLKATQEYEGSSLVPLMDGRSPDVQRGRAFEEAFSELGPEIHSLRTPGWQYIYNPKRYSSIGAQDSSRGRMGYFRLDDEELYDLTNDPRQQKNLAKTRPEVARSMQRRLLEWLEGKPSSTLDGEIDPRALPELRALGYVEEGGATEERARPGSTRGGE